MDLSVLNLAVPQLSADLRPSAAQLLWIVDIYGFLLAGFLIGTLGDPIGRSRLLLIGAGAITAAVLAKRVLRRVPTRTGIDRPSGETAGLAGAAGSVRSD